MDKRPAAESQILAARYELGSLLGTGGMASVRDAVDLRLGRRVAVKILRADLAEDARARARFETEAHASARLAHPNAVMVFDSGEDDGIPFLVMERLPGRTFADELTAGTLSLDRVLDVVREVLAALAAAHAAGIIHRDIKPGNVLLTEDGHAKVSDFGIAKTIDDRDQTQTVELLATPGYLAPERLGGEVASERSDLYSVGVLLYEALSGRRPFRGDTPVALMRAIERGRPEPLAALRPGLPPEVVSVAERSMAVDPGARFASATEMAVALERAPSVDAPAAIVGADESATVAIDRASHDGETQSLFPAGARIVEDTPAGPGRRRALAAGGAVVLIALLIGVIAVQRDPAHPAAPRSTVTSRPVAPSTTTAITTAPRTLLPTRAAPPGPAHKPPGKKKSHPGKGP